MSAGCGSDPEVLPLGGADSADSHGGDTVEAEDSADAPDPDDALDAGDTADAEDPLDGSDSDEVPDVADTRDASDVADSSDAGDEVSDSSDSDDADDTENPPDVPDAGDVGPTCGNGRLDPLELCDGTAFASGYTCGSLDHGVGNLRCTEYCELDVSGCRASICGDGLVTGEEACDPFGPSGVCDDMIAGSVGVVRCDPLTCEWDASECTLCGNDQLDGGEECDGDVFVHDSCSHVDMVDGTLLCTDACEADYSECLPWLCGDGLVHGDEVCDGRAGMAVTCVELSELLEEPFVGGHVTCSEDCLSHDTSGCTTVEGFPDLDGDTVPDEYDNCPETANQYQLDADNDGIGNVCDEPLVLTTIVSDEPVVFDSWAASSGHVHQFDRVVSSASATLEFDDTGALTVWLTLEFEDQVEVVAYVINAPFPLEGEIEVEIVDAVTSSPPEAPMVSNDVSDGSSPPHAGGRVAPDMRFVATGNVGEHQMLVDSTVVLGSESASVSRFDAVRQQYVFEVHAPSTEIQRFSYSDGADFSSTLRLYGLEGSITLQAP